MKIAVVKERRPFELRVAATPETVKKMIANGWDVYVEKNAGLASSFTDQDYEKNGAIIVSDYKDCVEKADIVLKVQKPLLGEEGIDEGAPLSPGTCLISHLFPHADKDQLDFYASQRIKSIALDLMPRITRAQSMDVLSSQSNLAGYRSVIEAATVFNRAFPMMMTAAGTIPPARVVVLGAGVAGLQAIATARRLGAIVSAFDVRPAAKEQVESLGATFISVEAEESGETVGGYAKEMGDDYRRRQGEKIAETLKNNDIAITTALIPGMRAPLLITEAMIKQMKQGSVILDMAVESGGNVALSRLGEVVEVHGVKIIGHPNLPSRIARDASSLYARNIFSFLSLLVPKDTSTITLNLEDPILKAVTLTQNGSIIHDSFKKEPSL